MGCLFRIASMEPGRKRWFQFTRYSFGRRGEIVATSFGPASPAAWVCVLILLVGTSGPARSEQSSGGWRLADSGSLPAALNADGWSVLFQSQTPSTRFALDPDGRIEIEAHDSVAFLFRAVRDEERESTRLNWRWTVLESLAPVDLRAVGGDDRPAAVHLWFDRPADETGFLDRLAGRAAALMGLPKPGKMITYVWGGSHPPGSRFANPYRPRDGIIVVLRPGDAQVGEWHQERIDFAADFRWAFGYTPPAPRYLALSADSDNAGGRSLALVSDLSFGDGGT